MIFIKFKPTLEFLTHPKPFPPRKEVQLFEPQLAVLGNLLHLSFTEMGTPKSGGKYFYRSSSSSIVQFLFPLFFF
jgi:hypothetical protein